MYIHEMYISSKYRAANGIYHQKAHNYNSKINL